jgi:hypothetical protein
LLFWTKQKTQVGTLTTFQLFVKHWSNSMTDFRALCAELADSLEEWLSSNSIGGISLDDGTDAELIYRARTALAQPEPQKPTDEELDAVWDEEAGYFALYVETKRFARAVLARWGCQ